MRRQKIRVRFSPYQPDPVLLNYENPIFNSFPHSIFFLNASPTAPCSALVSWLPLKKSKPLASLISTDQSSNFFITLADVFLFVLFFGVCVCVLGVGGMRGEFRRRVTDNCRVNLIGNSEGKRQIFYTSESVR